MVTGWSETHHSSGSNCNCSSNRYCRCFLFSQTLSIAARLLAGKKRRGEEGEGEWREAWVGSWGWGFFKHKEP